MEAVQAVEEVESVAAGADAVANGVDRWVSGV